MSTNPITRGKVVAAYKLREADTTTCLHPTPAVDAAEKRLRVSERAERLAIYKLAAVGAAVGALWRQCVHDDNDGG